MVMFRRKYLGVIAASLMSVLTLRRARADSGRISRMEFNTSGRRMGLRFPERLRDIWRHRWLKLRKQK